MYIITVRNSKKKIYTPQTKETGESNQQIFFLSFSIQLVYVRYNYKRVKNPLFLQPDRSFDFGINFLYQYTVSSTHPSPIHKNNWDSLKKKKINGPLTEEPTLSHIRH